MSARAGRGLSAFSQIPMAMVKETPRSISPLLPKSPTLLFAEPPAHAHQKVAVLEILMNN